MPVFNLEKIKKHVLPWSLGCPGKTVILFSVQLLPLLSSPTCCAGRKVPFLGTKS